MQEQKIRNNKQTAKDQQTNRVAAILMILVCKCKNKNKKQTNKKNINWQRELQLSWWPDARQQRASQTHDAALLASASDLYRVVLYHIVLASASTTDWYKHTFVGVLVITLANKIHISRYKHRDSKGLCLGHWLIQAQCNFCLHQHNYKYKMHLDCYQILAHCRLQHLLTLVYAAAWKGRSKKRPKCTEGVSSL